MAVEFAIIGGSGLETAPAGESLAVATPFGVVTLTRLRLGGRELLFLPRHGGSPRPLPHQVNSRAQIWALHAVGVRATLALNACGGIRDDLLPGTLTPFDDWLDFTRDRPRTFAGSADYGTDPERFHLDVSVPYCPTLRSCLDEAAAAAGVTLAAPSVYACVEGPRYETPAEVRMIRQLGGDVVGMTGLPEAVLARELGLCYAGLGIVGNRAAGLAAAPLSHREVVAVVARCRAALDRLLLAMAARVPATWRCPRCPRPR